MNYLCEADVCCELGSFALFLAAGEEEEDQARDQDPGKPARWSEYHLPYRHRQRPCGGY